MKLTEHGFTLVEIVVVMVLISIIAAAVFTRSITTDELNLISRAEKVQAHIRYAQSMAIKKNEVWGIFSNGSQYWLFNGWQPADVMTGIALPGENDNAITLAGSGLHLNFFSLFFDSLGKPYTLIDQWPPDPLTAVSAANPINITITSDEDNTLNRKLSITPETGLIVVIP